MKHPVLQKLIEQLSTERSPANRKDAKRNEVINTLIDLLQKACVKPNENNIANVLIYIESIEIYLGMFRGTKSMHQLLKDSNQFTYSDITPAASITADYNTVQKLSGFLSNTLVKNNGEAFTALDTLLLETHQELAGIEKLHQLNENGQIETDGIKNWRDWALELNGNQNKNRDDSALTGDLTRDTKLFGISTKDVIETIELLKTNPSSEEENKINPEQLEIATVFLSENLSEEKLKHKVATYLLNRLFQLSNLDSQAQERARAFINKFGGHDMITAVTEHMSPIWQEKGYNLGATTERSHESWTVDKDGNIICQINVEIASAVNIHTLQQNLRLIGESTLTVEPGEQDNTGFFVAYAAPGEYKKMVDEGDTYAPIYNAKMTILLDCKDKTHDELAMPRVTEFIESTYVKELKGPIHFDQDEILRKKALLEGLSY